jgi:hypothetical protein
LEEYIWRKMVKVLPQILTISSWRSDELFKIIKLNSSLTAEKELWTLIKSYSEVKQRGTFLLRKYNVPRSQEIKTWKRFRSYIRQSENYWLAASKTSYKSSSLLYYYSFLNLVKAYLLIKDFNMPHDMHHGLSFSTSDTSTSIRNKKLKVHTGEKDVANNYFKAVFGYMPQREYFITDLLAYVTDVGFQYESGLFGKIKSFPINFKIYVKQEDKKIGGVLCIPTNSSLEKYKYSLIDFYKCFQKVKLPSIVGQDIREVFNFRASEWQHYVFYQFHEDREATYENNMIPGIIDVIDKVKGCLGNKLSPNYYADNHSAFVNLPINRKKNYDMNEEISIYLVMFFMSEIVRYRPDYLDEILDSKAAWLLESFVESTPLKFLRAITSRIVGEVFVISSL